MSIRVPDWAIYEHGAGAADGWTPDHHLDGGVERGGVVHDVGMDPPELRLAGRVCRLGSARLGLTIARRLRPMKIP